MKFQKGNRFSVGLTNNGRPPKYSDDDEGYNDFHKKCVEYFEREEEQGKKATITGLALYLGFSSRGTLNEYAKKKVFGEITKRAMLMVENSYENSATTFDMFALKNMGWSDKQEIEQTVTNIEPLTREEVELAKKKIDDQI